MDLLTKLYQDEGNRPCVYQDSLGYWTIGVGICVDQRVPGAGLTPDEVMFLLQSRINRARAQLTEQLPWISALDEPRASVLIEMAFQLGDHGLLQFHNALTAAQSGDFETAATQLLASKWATQTPERAKRLAEQLRTGQWST